MVRSISCLFCLLLVIGLGSSSFAVSPMPDLATPPLEKNDDQVRTLAGCFIKLANGHVLFAKHRPARPGMPTIMLANGIPDGLDDWNGLDAKLHAEGYGVISFDFRGQNNSLWYSGSNFSQTIQERLGGDLSWQAQVGDMHDILQFFGIQKVIMSGLSYGGGMALAFSRLYPAMVEKVVAFAPYIAPLKAAIAQIRQLASAMFMWFPLMSESDRMELAGEYLAYTEGPLGEPELLERPYGLGVESLLAMTRGLKGLNNEDTLQVLPKGSLALVDGTNDLVVPPSMLDIAYEKSGLAKLVRIYYDWGQHRATTWDPGGALTIFNKILSNTTIPGSYLSYNPFTKIFSTMKAAGNPVGFIDGGSCRELFN